MTLSRAHLAEKSAAIERHLRRVADQLPDPAEAFLPGTEASDAVILHLWQATQSVIDLALSWALRVHGSAPTSYRESFLLLARYGHLEHQLATRLAQAAGFRNLLVHGYDELDLERVREAATNGPADLRAFLAAARDGMAGPVGD